MPDELGEKEMSEQKKSKFKIWTLCLGIILLISVMIIGNTFQKQWSSTVLLLGMDRYQIYKSGSNFMIILAMALISISFKNISLAKVFFVILLIAIVAAISIPNYLNFPYRAHQSPTRINLIKLINTQNKYYSANGRYATSFQLDLGHWENDPWHCYYLSEAEIIKPSPRYNCPTPPHPKPSVENDRFLIIAAGSIDNDATLDVWSIDEKKVLKNLVDDVRN